MSSAFVQGTSRQPSQEELPTTMVKLVYHGKLNSNGMRVFPRPIPFAINSMAEKDPLIVQKDRTCLASVDEATFLLNLNGPFTKYEVDKKPVMPIMQEVISAEFESPVMPEDELLEQLTKPTGSKQTSVKSKGV